MSAVVVAGRDDEEQQDESYRQWTEFFGGRIEAEDGQVLSGRRPAPLSDKEVVKNTPGLRRGPLYRPAGSRHEDDGDDVTPEGAEQGVLTYHDVLTAVAAAYPERRSITLSYKDVAGWTPPQPVSRRSHAEDDGVERASALSRENVIAAKLLSEPIKQFASIQRALRDIVTPRALGGGGRTFQFPNAQGIMTGSSSEPFIVEVRIVNLHSQSQVTIRTFRHSHLGKLIQVEGLVKTLTEAYPRILAARWRCSRCGNTLTTNHNKDWSDELLEPTECYEEQGGCGREARFEQIEEQSTWSTIQFVSMQEPPETMRGGTQPLSLDGMLLDDLVDGVRPGDRVVVVGYVAPMPVKRHGKLQRHHEKRFVIVSVRKHTETFDEVIITEEDERRIREEATARGPDGEWLIFQRMRASLAPTIIGWEYIKDALVLALVGGVSKKRDRMKVRGDIHVLLAGDPGMAKSVLIRAGCEMSPRFQFTSGNQGTTAGLLAAVVKDELTGGGFALEAGAMVLADQGVMGLDEMEKMEKEHLKNLTTALEQQRVNIAKAGIQAELNCRTTVFAAVNPKGGRFKDGIPILDQIELPDYIKSRFLIFVMKDKANRNLDLAMGQNILTMHRSMLDEEDPTAEPFYDEVFVRKVIAYVKRNVFPRLSDGVIRKLSEYYATVRNLPVTGEDNGTGATVRQLEDLERLAEARARLRLSPAVELEDADAAIDIYKKYVEAVAQDAATGELNFGIVNAPSASQTERQSIIREAALALQRQREGVLPARVGPQGPDWDLAELSAEVARRSRHVSAAQVEATFNNWVRRGRELMEPRSGRFRLVE